MPAGTELIVSEPTLPAIPVNSAEEAAQFAVLNNAKICEAQQDILKAHAGIKAAKMDCLPTVDVLGGYVNQNIADYIQPNIGFVGVTGPSANVAGMATKRTKAVAKPNDLAVALIVFPSSISKDLRAWRCVSCGKPFYLNFWLLAHY